MAWTLVSHPGTIADAWLSRYRLGLLTRTLGCNVLAAIIAAFMGLPAAFLMGRGRGPLARAMWLVAPAALLIPLLAFSYGWLQAVRIAQPLSRSLGIVFVPGGVADALRCVWTLASWLWGVPACIIGLSLRRLHPDLQLAASLHGATLRVTFRMLLGPIIASIAIVTVLATQEFAVYEPTGVGVVATEVRMVFSTGAFSSLLPAGSEGGPDQAQRAAAAAMTAAPLLLVTAVLALLAARGARRLTVGETLHVGDWPPVLDARPRTAVAAVCVVLLTVGVPVAALVASLKKPDPPAQLWKEFGAPMMGSLLLFVIVAAAGTAVTLSASVRRTPGLLTAAVASFLLGGEMTAIALIRVFNRPGFEWVSGSAALPAIAYLARFTCVAIIAADWTWSTSWDELRMQAVACGASPLQTAARIVWPLAWPAILAAALLTGTLSLTEVAATGTLIPQHPPVLTTKLLTWAHAARSDRMIEGSLLIVVLVLVPAGLLFTLWGMTKSWMRRSATRADV